MIPKSIVSFLSIFFLFSLSFGQEAVQTVGLASNALNTAHPFYQVLQKKDAKYMEWLYFHCKGLSPKNSLRFPMNKNLVFSIKQEGITVKDTIANCVHPKLYENDRELEWQSELPLYGSFPKYVNFHLSNDPEKAATIDLSINRDESNLKIYVLTEDGDMVATITNKRFTKGNHRLHWVTKEIKAGTYLLFTEIDTHLTIHSLRIEKNWWANLFSRDKEISRKKRFTSTSYETLDMPQLKGEFQYINMNRFGTSYGLNLLKASMVIIKLYSINGTYLSTILHKKLKAGASEFLLDKYIETPGLYLVQSTVNGNRKHIKVKIKK